MPLITGDFVARLSGGAGNSVGNASLGGVKSSTVAPTALDSLFDQVSTAEASAGRIEYRCIYLHNANASSTMLNTVVYISSNTPLAGSVIDVGVGTAAINGTEQTVANETTAPSGVSFSAPSTQGTGLALGDIAAGQHKAVWIRRTMTAGAGAIASDPFTLTFYADFTS